MAVLTGFHVSKGTASRNINYDPETVKSVPAVYGPGIFYSSYMCPFEGFNSKFIVLKGQIYGKKG